MRTAPKNHLIEFATALGDDSLILGQRVAEWCGNAPLLEEELAMANVALDFLGRAQFLYEYVSELDGGERSPDDIAFLRDSRQYRNLLIMELPNGDFAFSMARQFMVDTFNVLYLRQLAESSDRRLAAIAAKAVKESQYHLRRSRGWVVRLGDGTEESHERMLTAFEELRAYVPELFEMTGDETALLEAGVSVDRTALRNDWHSAMAHTLAEATLGQSAGNRCIRGGRDGVHTEHHGHLLAELQFMQRAYPGLQW